MLDIYTDMEYRRLTRLCLILISQSGMTLQSSVQLITQRYGCNYLRLYASTNTVFLRLADRDADALLRSIVGGDKYDSAPAEDGQSVVYTLRRVV